MSGPRRRVVVTGLGVISPIGIGKENFLAGLRAGRSGIAPITRFDASGYESRVAGEVNDFDAVEHLGLRRVNQMGRAAQFAVAAAGMALDDGGLNLDAVDKERAGSVIGTAVGDLGWAIEEALTQDHNGHVASNPRTMFMAYPNSVSGQVSIRYGLNGATDTISSGCASGGTAFGLASNLIQRDEADVLLVGGTEAPLHPTIFRNLCAAGALSTMNGGGRPSPFDKDRDGPVLAEGAGIVVFEELGHALRRDATIYAEFMGWGSTTDAFSLTRTEPNGIQGIRASQVALKNSLVATDEVDYISAYGIATPSCDWTETRIAKMVFGDRARTIPISAIQSMVGYSWAAMGALQFIASCLAITEGVIHPTINYAAKDVNCDLDYVPNVARDLRIDTAVTDQFGCGKNVVTVIRRYNGFG